MLEIIILCSLYGALVPKVKKKNRSKWLPLIAPALWLLGEFVLAFIVGIIFYFNGMSAENIEFYMQGVVWAGGIIGAGIAFLIIHKLPVKSLKCPECQTEFKLVSELGTATCTNCDTKLKIWFNKVKKLQVA
ncbi:MAG: hypothetical protein V5783_11930 [Pontiella sp.]